MKQVAPRRYAVVESLFFGVGVYLLRLPTINCSSFFGQSGDALLAWLFAILAVAFAIYSDIPLPAMLRERDARRRIRSGRNPERDARRRAAERGVDVFARIIISPVTILGTIFRTTTGGWNDALIMDVGLGFLFVGVSGPLLALAYLQRREEQEDSSRRTHEP